jgi:hypothetical protein
MGDDPAPQVQGAAAVIKFAATAKKHSQAMIPPLVALEYGLSPEAIANLKDTLLHETAEQIIGSTAELDAYWAENDAASGLTTLNAQPALPEGEPGQVLAVDEDGKPEWITLPLDFASPPPKTPVVAALDALSDAGVHVGHIDVSQTYHPGELPQINLTMTLHTMPKNMGDLIADVHAWAAKKGGTLA